MAAQKRAAVEFRDERPDAEIVIESFRPRGGPEIYASKLPLHRIINLTNS